jgi:hypothetical protein
LRDVSQGTFEVNKAAASPIEKPQMNVAAIMQQVIDCSSRVIHVVMMHTPHAYTLASIAEMFLDSRSRPLCMFICLMSDEIACMFEQGCLLGVTVLTLYNRSESTEWYVTSFRIAASASHFKPVTND